MCPIVHKEILCAVFDLKANIPKLLLVVALSDSGDKDNTLLFVACIIVFPFVRQRTLMLLRALTKAISSSEITLFAALNALLAASKAESV